VLMLLLTFTRDPLTQYPHRDSWSDLRDGVRQSVQWLKYEARHLLHRE